MRVLHAIDALGMGGGAEHSLAAMLPRLRERGVESAVVCSFPRRGGLQQRLRREGFEVKVLESSSLFSRILEMRATIRAWRPDLIHATLFKSCLTARVASWGLGIPQLDSLVNTPYDPVRERSLGVPRWKLRIVQAVDTLTARLFVDHFHAVSASVALVASEGLGIAPGRITVIPRGRSVQALSRARTRSRASTLRDLEMDPKRPVLLNVGRQDSQKGQELLVRAMPEILRQHPDAVLLIVGREGSATAGIRRAVERSALDSAVKLLGHRDDIPDLLHAADLFVFPSFYEGTGGAAIEAMASGLPVIASDIAAMREVLGSDCGLLVPPGDELALAQAAGRLLDDPVQRVRFAERGRDRFLQRYTLDAAVDSTLDLYRKLLLEV